MSDRRDVVRPEALVRPPVFRLQPRDVDEAVDEAVAGDEVPDPGTDAFRDGVAVQGPCDLGERGAGGRALEREEGAGLEGLFGEGVGQDGRIVWKSVRNSLKLL